MHLGAFNLHNIYQFVLRNSLIIAFFLLISAGNTYFFHENQQFEIKQIEKYVSLSQHVNSHSYADIWFNLPSKDAIQRSKVDTAPDISQFTLLDSSLTPNLPVTEYKSFKINDRLYHFPKTLLAEFDITSWLLFHLLLLAPLFVAWRWQLQQEKLKKEQLLFENNLNELIQQSELPATSQLSLIEKLKVIGDGLQSQQKRQQEIRHLVRVQGLIDHDLAIGNRIYFESKLQHFLVDPAEPATGALLLLQISRVHDKYEIITHLQRLVGVVEMVTQLTSHLPQTVIARVAEADIAILIPGLAQKETEDLGDRIAVVLSKSSYFVGLQDHDLLHLGYVNYLKGQNSYQVMAEADMALKTAQLHGPNAAFGFSTVQKPKIKGSVWWRTELSNALREQRFILSFQPVFSASQDDIIQHEVLVRLESSEKDLLSAAVFLPMAANCGLTSKIDEYVLLKAAKFCQMEHGAQPICSINVSVSSLLNKEWWSWLEQMVETKQLVPSQLAFEFDEYHVLRQYKSLKNKLLQLHQLGFSLIVDHVGLAIEACPYLVEIPLDAIKLHPSVIRGIDQQLEQQLYIRGLLATNAEQQIRVIACGVETAAEWKCLQKLGVSAAQGYYFSQPLAQLMAQNESS